MIIIYPPTLDFGVMRQRPQQLMLQFARNGHQVYFCDHTQQPGRLPQQIAPGLTVIHDHPHFVREIVPTLGETVVWCSWAALHDSLDAYHPRLVVFDCVDDFPEWRTYEPPMLARADAVVVTSTALERRLRPHHSRLALIPNGCDFDFFHTKPAGPPPMDLPVRVRPRAMFVGAWGSWVDSQLMSVVAKQLSHWDFIFIGPPFGGLQVWGRNIYNLGIRPYERLPGYLHNADVALIPFRHNQVTRAANPIKLWEYLATGIPVVSTALPEVLPLAGVVRIGDVSTFSRQIEAARFDLPLRDDRIAVARANSWEGRYQAITQFVPELTG